MSEEENKYLLEYYKNEYDANRQMSFANVLGAVLMLGLWICYLTGAFFANPKIMVLLNIIFPIDIVVLLTPLVYTIFFKEQLKRPGYKNFVVFSFILVVAALNLVLPKNSAIAWALCVMITNHYYNPKFGRITFFVVLGLMLICLYGSMFVGEYDPNILGAAAIENGEVKEIFGIVERYEFLHEALVNGENRYLQTFVYTFLPRALLFALVYIVCNSLNVRTYKLLVSEIKVNSEQEKMNTELEVAKEIQLNTLPSEVTSSEDVEIVAELKAAKEVGGDFYDYFNIDDDHVAIVIGDVSGKGVPAAMFMMKTITCFKNFVRPNKTPAEILREVNASIYDPNSQMFVTVFLGILDKRTGELKFANAGHNPPVLGKKRDYHFIKCKPGFVLGGLEEAMVTDESLTLQAGEELTLYTDGITEARNKKGDFFGDARLIEACNKKDYTCLVEFHHGIKDELSAFVGDAPQADDITFLTIKYHGDRYSYEEKVFEGFSSNVSQMLDFIGEFCDKQNLEKAFKTNLLVVGDELVSNIIKYGYEDKGGVIFIRQLYNVDSKEYVLTVIDRAPQFNQLDVNNSAVGSDANKQKIGGLGILIVKKIMSEYAYDYINGKNILVLRKRF